MQLVSFLTPSGHTVWINPDHVRSLGQAGDKVIITFSNGNENAVSGDAEAVAAALAGKPDPGRFG